MSNDRSFVNGPRYRLGFIGAGAMGEALAAGILRAGLARPDDVWLADADDVRLADVTARLGVQSGTNKVVAARADVLLLAVKPQFVGDVLQDIAGAIGPGVLIVSIAAGVTLAAIEGALPPDTPVVRVMPNTPALIGAGATAIAQGRAAEPAHIELVRTLFEAVGTATVVPESLLDAVTGLSGSGPAYVYLFIEALADGGVLAGLPRDVALRLAAQTVLGGAQMVLQTGKHPGELKDMVTSPAGTTIAGVAALEEGAFRAACMGAVAAAAARAAELGREQEASIA